jgi:hypothetical protein
VYYAIAAVGIVITLVVGRLAYFAWLGGRMNNALLTGRFDQSQVGKTFTEWFRSRPEREQQRELFVQFALAMGQPHAHAAEQVLRCVTKAMGGQHGLGDLLACEVGDMILYDPPQNAEQEMQQRISKQDLEDFMGRLRSLDHDGS